MTEPEQRYRKLTLDLMWERIQRKVTQEEEASYTEDLDQCWFEMTKQQREVAEAWFADLKRIPAPSLLPFVDPAVGQSSTQSPRIHQ